MQFLTDNTDFTVIGVIGPPGVGKSTILNELYGFDGTSPGISHTHFSKLFMLLVNNVSHLKYSKTLAYMLRVLLAAYSKQNVKL